ncbi:ThiF family adenylyltransferase, partial [Pseudomonas aeruginosa]|uniref:ThiF family adenylyltransferase n=1 Tax=Pseudomonas aeruginosa TaxID=287 RepID=UPI00053A2A08
MSAGTTLVLTGALHARLQQHLLPPDGLEAVAILLCKRMRTENRLKLLCKDAVLVPYGECTRVRDYLEWPGRRLLEAVVLAEPDELSLVLIHSHPGGLYDFSQSDSESDAQVIPQVFANLESADQSDVVHGSAIMVPGGAIRARVYDYKHQMAPINLVAVYGDDIRLFWNDDNQPLHHAIAFSDEMRSELGRLTVAVIGYSGTGSIAAEQLARIGFGGMVVVDYDQVENRNLNRIINSTVADAAESQLKVNVYRRAAAAF